MALDCDDTVRRFVALARTHELAQDIALQMALVRDCDDAANLRWRDRYRSLEQCPAAHDEAPAGPAGEGLV